MPTSTEPERSTPVEAQLWGHLRGILELVKTGEQSTDDVVTLSIFGAIRRVTAQGALVLSDAVTVRAKERVL